MADGQAGRKTGEKHRGCVSDRQTDGQKSGDEDRKTDSQIIESDREQWAFVYTVWKINNHSPAFPRLVTIASLQATIEDKDNNGLLSKNAGPCMIQAAKKEIDRWTDGRTDGRTGGRTDGRTDRKLNR